MLDISRGRIPGRSSCTSWYLDVEEEEGMMVPPLLWAHVY